MPELRAAAMVAVISLVTIALRFLPFWIFGESRKTPPWLVYLGQVLPFAIMGMLVVYCLKDISFLSSPYGIPQLLSCAVVAALHVWKRSTLLSIAGGTACYMLLIQFVFA